MDHKRLLCNQKEMIGLLETFAVCGILETREHKGYLNSFTLPRMRDTEDVRQSLSYSLRKSTYDRMCFLKLLFGRCFFRRIFNDFIIFHILGHLFQFRNLI